MKAPPLPRDIGPADPVVEEISPSGRPAGTVFCISPPLRFGPTFAAGSRRVRCPEFIAGVPSERCWPIPILLLDMLLSLLFVAVQIGSAVQVCLFSLYYFASENVASGADMRRSAAPRRTPMPAYSGSSGCGRSEE